MIDETELEEENYFASMTDIMVGLLFIFIILIMFFAMQIGEIKPEFVAKKIHEAVVQQNEILKKENVLLREDVTLLKQKNDRLKVQVTVLTKKIIQLESQLVELEKNLLSKYLSDSDSQRTKILKQIQTSMREVGFEVEIIEEQGVVRLPNKLLFATGRSTIQSGGTAEKALIQLVIALEKVLPCFTLGRNSESKRNTKCNPSAAFIETVFVEGHTDNIPVLGEIEPGISDNLSLSARRATNIFKKLVKNNKGLLEYLSVDKEPILNIAAYGATRPIKNNTDISRNRRIDLRFLMYTPRSDTLDEVKRLVGEE
ncbi:MAG: OmpA family protein [Hyphomicrobiales bacterium]